jgi:predicted MFS family arabinose efflux permease
MSAVLAGAPSYRGVLGLPHARRLFLTAALGRLAYAVLPLSLLLTVAQATSSFTVAGLTAAALGLTVVLAGPWRAGLVDRYGRRALAYLMFAYVAAGLGLLLSLERHAPMAVVIGMAAVAGACPPPLGPSMRVVWARLTTSDEERQRAYSLDAVTEEVLFTTGLLLTGATIGVAAPQAAYLGGLALVAVGTVAFVLSPAPPLGLAEPSSRAVAPGVFRAPGFAPMLIMIAGTSGAMALVYLAVPVIATRIGSPALAGPLEAAIAAGSAAGGLLYGRRTWTSSLPARLATAAIALSAVIVAMAMTPWPLLLGTQLAIAGLFLSPTLIIGYTLADRLTPEHSQTRASIWVNTAANGGSTAGTVLAGLLADRQPIRVLFLVAAALLLTVAATAGRTLLGMGHKAQRPSDDRT